MKHATVSTFNLFTVLFIVLCCWGLCFTTVWAQSVQIHLSDGSVRSYELSRIDSVTFSEQSTIRGLVAYYPFSGNAIDATGNGNHGTVHGAILTSDRTSYPNSAYDFDGSTSYIEVPDNALLRPDSITICAWIYPRAHTDTRMGILYKSTYATAANEQYSLNIASDRHFLGSIKRNSTCQPATGWQNVTGPDEITLNQWSFLCLTWDGETLKSYLNGVLRATNTSVPAGAVDNCPGGTLRIGLLHQNDRIPFNGKLDDIRIYNRALTDVEVMTLYGE